LNTLSALVVAQPVVAEEFIHRLSAIYRYILENGSKDRVPLSEELVFIGIISTYIESVIMAKFRWKLISVILESIKSFLFTSDTGRKRSKT